MSTKYNSIECVLHSISQPDYWQGSSKMIVAVPLHHGMTLAEFQSEFLREISNCDYSYDLNEMLSATELDDADLLGAFKTQFVDGNDVTKVIYEYPFPNEVDEEEEQDSMNTVYAYLMFRKNEEYDDVN